MTNAANQAEAIHHRTKEAAKTAASLEELFVDTSRYKTVLSEILIVHEQRKAADAAGTLKKARGFALVAPTGSGKTRTLERVFSNIEAMNGKTGGPGDRIVLSLNVATPANLKSVGIAILKALGVHRLNEGPRSDSGTYPEIWEMIYAQLMLQKIEILHLDEAQDLYENANKLQRKAVLNTLKTLTQNNAWPVCLVLSGTEQLERVLNDDYQLGRRLNTMNLAPLKYATDRKSLEKIVKTYIDGAGLQDNASTTDNFLPRMIVGTCARFGIFIEVLIEAVRCAVFSESPSVELEHFCAGYKRRASCTAEFNPFISVEWRKIDASKLFEKEPPPSTSRKRTPRVVNSDDE